MPRGPGVVGKFFQPEPRGPPPLPGGSVLFFFPGTTEARRRVLFPVAAARRPAKFGKCELIVGSSSLQAAAWVFKPSQSATLGSLSFQRAGNLKRLVLCSALRPRSVASAYLGRSGLGPHWREPCTRESAARGAGTLPTLHRPGGKKAPERVRRAPPAGPGKPREPWPTLLWSPPRSRHARATGWDLNPKQGLRFSFPL